MGRHLVLTSWTTTSGDATLLTFPKTAMNARLPFDGGAENAGVKNAGVIMRRNSSEKIP